VSVLAMTTPCCVYWFANIPETAVFSETSVDESITTRYLSPRNGIKISHESPLKSGGRNNSVFGKC
jgi:hypothetical protein